MVYWKSCPAGTGGWPIRPRPPARSARAGALITSLAVRLRDGELVRVEPDAHAVVVRAEEAHVADARQAGQGVLDLDGGVVAQVELVVARRPGESRLTHSRMLGDFFLVVTPCRLHLLGQLGLGDRDAVLHQHLGHVEVGARART